MATRGIVRIKASLGLLTTLALLVLYTASTLRLDSIHQFFHAENIAELHSAKKESDPCHKNIYHQQKQSGCEHKSHITENSKCPFCEYISGSKEILSTEVDLTISIWPTITRLPHQESILSFYIHRGSGRSPPQA